MPMVVAWTGTSHCQAVATTVGVLCVTLVRLVVVDAQRSEGVATDVLVVLVLVLVAVVTVVGAVVMEALGMLLGRSDRLDPLGQWRQHRTRSGPTSARPAPTHPHSHNNRRRPGRRGIRREQLMVM
jgi:hypothetical protein